MTGGRTSNNDIDLTKEIHLLLKSAQALEGRFGLVVLISFVCGKKNGKLYNRMLTHQLFGKGKDYTELFWKALGKCMSDMITLID